MPMTEREVLAFTLGRLSVRTEVTTANGVMMHAFPRTAIDDVVAAIAGLLGVTLDEVRHEPRQSGETSAP